MNSIATDIESVDSSGRASAGGRRALWIAGGAAIAVLVLLFIVWPYQHWKFSSEARSSVLYGWAKILLQPESNEWLFCFVVPVLVGWLVWRGRAELAALPLEGHWLGVLPIVLGAASFWVGFKVDTGYAGYIAAQVVVAGLIILLAGWRWMQALLFPWLFLAFMWPMFPLEEMMASKLRLITADFSVKFLNLIGIGALQDGSAVFSAADPAKGLAMGDLFRLDVNAECSGIQSLFSLLMISALYGYIALKRNGPRMLLFLSAIPLAMLGNFVRMVLLALGCIWFGPEVAVGRTISADHQEVSAYHMLCGYLVFAVALTGMFAICSLLEKKHWKKLAKQKKASAAPASSGAWAIASQPRLMLQSGAAVALALGTVAVCAATDTRRIAAAPGVTMELPLQFGAYQGVEYEMTAFERNLLPEEVEISRVQYLSPGAAHVITASTVLSGAGKRDLHRPEICLPAQGFQLQPPRKMTLALENGQSVEASFIRMTRDDRSSLGQIQRTPGVAVYWYVGSDGTTCADYYEHIRVTYQDAIIKNINHRWAMVAFYMIMPPAPLGIPDQMAELAAVEELRTFIGKIAPRMAKPAP